MIGLLVIALVMGAGGCASYNPVPMAEVGFLERAQSDSKEGITVTVAVLSAKESASIYGRPIAKKGIQPVWIEIRNDGDIPFSLIKRSLDPNYFTASEAAYMHRVGKGAVDAQMADDYRAMAYDGMIAPGETRSGFILTRLDVGTKVVTVMLFGPRTTRQFVFYVPVPGIKADYHATDFDALYDESEIVDFTDEQLFRQTLREFQCCTQNEAETKDGDPLNIVIISEADTLIAAMVRSGWDETEALTLSTALKTAKAFFADNAYKHSPISPQYLFGRPQDITFQKARDTIHERNHMRLWLSPWRERGIPVWIGQISRDIGVRMTTGTWNLMTHAIDPDVDDARSFLVQDLAAVQALEALGFVQGVGESTPENPRTILLGDPYFTDGFRVVMLLSEEPIALDEIRIVDWDWRSDDDPARAFVPGARDEH